MQPQNPPVPSWRMSCHGGHSGLYCDHAEDTPELIAEAAVAAGLSTFAFTEHAPRAHERYLYITEREWGWTVGTLYEKFAAYAAHLDRLVAEYSGRITLLRGFEIEVIPHGEYADAMLGFRRDFGLEWMVGSVHYVNDIIIDFTEDLWHEAAQTCGGIERMGVKYYELVAEMAETMRPEVIGHFDLLRRNAPDEDCIATPAVREAAFRALDAIGRTDAAIEVNTAGYRKGFGRPYPAPWILDAILERGLPLVLSDDSHRAVDVGAGYADAARYLWEAGVRELKCPTRTPSGLQLISVSLPAPERNSGPAEL